MANHKSSEKRARQTIKRTQANSFYRTRLKNISRGFLKTQTASRRVSRLAKLVNTLN